MATTTFFLQGNVSFVAFRNDNSLKVPLPEFIPCAAPGDVIDERTRKMIKTIIYVAVLPLLLAIGTITNILNCIVFYRQGLQDHVNSLLSLLDLLCLIAMCGWYFSHTLENIFGKQIRIDVDFSLIRFYLVGVPTSIAVIANLVSTLISVDRCVHIALPLQVQGVVSRRVFGVIFWVVSLALVCSNESIILSYDTACVYYSDSQVQSTWLVIPSTFYMENKAFLDILDTVIMNSFVPFLSLTVMAVTTVITASKLKSSMTWRKEVSSSSQLCRKEITRTRMLIVISGIYIACVSPRVLTSLIRLLEPDYRPWRRLCNLAVVMETLINGLHAFNSVINFFVYVSLGTKFKQSLQRLIVC